MRRVDFKTDGYNVHLLQTDKYHEVSFDIVFEKNLTQEDFIYRKLLLTVLYNSVYNSQKERQRQELKIYKPNYDFYQEIKGNVILYHFSGQFIHEKYTEKGMNDKNISYFLKYAYNENIIKNGISKEIFEYTKNKMLNRLETMPDNKEAYAYNELLALQKIYPFESNLQEQITSLKSTSEKELYDYYLKLINTSKVEVFLVGNIDEKEVKKVLNNNLNLNPRNTNLKQFYLSETKPVQGLKIERTDKIQSILFKSYYLSKMTAFEKNYVLPVLNNIIGINNGLLYREIREKESLCYYILSFSDKYTNSQYIHTAINAKDYERVEFLIKETLEKIKNGEYENEYLENAINKKLLELNKDSDYLNNLKRQFQDEIIFDADNIEEKRKNYRKVTKENVSTLVKKLNTSATFFLKGEEK